jgi:hypothetical protein
VDTSVLVAFTAEYNMGLAQVGLNGVNVGL